MQIEAMRKELRELIDKGDDTMIAELYDMVKSDDLAELTEEDIKELDERREKRLSGESKVYTWDEAKAMIQRRTT